MGCAEALTTVAPDAAPATEKNPWLVIRTLRYWVDGLREENSDALAKGGDPIADDDAFSLAMLYTSALELALGGVAMIGPKGTVWVRFADGTAVEPYRMIAQSVYQENTLLLFANMMRERLTSP